MHIQRFIFCATMFVIAFSLVSNCPTETIMSGVIEGIVMRVKDKRPIINAAITLINGNQTVFSDEQGRFVIKVPKAVTAKIIISKPGYYEAEKTYEINQGAAKSHHIFLYDYVRNNHKPSEPNLLLPNNNASIIGGNVEFSWECSEPDNQEMCYDIYIGVTESAATLVAANLRTPKFLANNLRMGKRYFWRVVALDPYGAKSESQIQSFTVDNESEGGVKSSLVLDMPFDNNLNNMSTNEFKITSKNITFTADRFGKPKKAAFFNGKSYVRIANHPAMALTEQFTLSAWVKPEVGYGNSHYGWIDIVGQWNATGPSTSSYILLLYIPDRKIVGAVHTGKKPNFICYSNADLIELEWTYLVFTFNNGIAQLYVNGILDNTIKAGAPQVSPYDMFIGSRNNGTAFFRGAMDDVRIYNRALSDYEISTLAKR